MISVYSKLAPGQNKVQLCTGLTLQEFQCQCTRPECKSTLVHDRLVMAYSTLRAHIDTPMKVNSGYRCPLHNFTMPQKGNEFSRHMFGCAIDVVPEEKYLTDVEFFRQAALSSGFEKALFYQEKKFFHLHVRLS